MLVGGAVLGHEATNPRLSVGPKSARPRPPLSAQFLDKPPVSGGFAPECAFGHIVGVDERRDVRQDGVLFHGPRVLRAIARMSMLNAGICTVLRAGGRYSIPWGMETESLIDLEKLKADMAACVEKTSARKFSLRATGGRNPDFYRNFVNDGRDKRMSAEVFVGIVAAMDRNPAEYVRGAASGLRLPSATVLTSALAALLETIGIDPFEDERAQKLARRFPDALRRFSTLHEGLAEGLETPLGEAPPDPDEDRPAA